MNSLRVRTAAKNALAEDDFRRDISSRAISPRIRAEAEIRAEQEMVVSGVEAAVEVFRICDPSAKILKQVRAGTVLGSSACILRVRSSARSLLAAERTALNFLAHLSGIATLTRAFVRAVPKNCRAKILDTRKTTPLWRRLEKQAVKDGGGMNHRMSLGDAVLLKDNHVEILGGVACAVAATRESIGRGVPIEVEVKSLSELREALRSGANRVLLDNMTDAQVREAVKIVGGDIPIEVSGGVTLSRVPRLARLGVDYISVGALTHSAPAARMSMDLKYLNL